VPLHLNKRLQDWIRCSLSLLRVHRSHQWFSSRCLRSIHFGLRRHRSQRSLTGLQKAPVSQIFSTHRMNNRELDTHSRLHQLHFRQRQPRLTVTREWRFKQSFNLSAHLALMNDAMTFNSRMISVLVHTTQTTVHTCTYFCNRLRFLSSVERHSIGFQRHCRRSLGNLLSLLASYQGLISCGTSILMYFQTRCTKTQDLTN
jgi:hypothetical protein